MKAIINGKRYDTETAEVLADLPCSFNRGDFKWHDTSVYRTQKGRFFLAGNGGAMSMWSQLIGNNGRGGGEGILALSDDEARDYLERCGADGMAAIEKYFPIEDA